MSENPQDPALHPADANWQAEQSPGFLLWHLENLWQREQRKALEPFDLTTVQFLLLAGLAATSAANAATSQIALARQCRTDPMMTSQVVRTLTKRNLVERAKDKTDKRAFAVRLTDQGRALLHAAEPAVRAVERGFFVSLGPDVTAFADALRLLGGERPRRRVQAVTRDA